MEDWVDSHFFFFFFRCTVLVSRSSSSVLPRLPHQQVSAEGPRQHHKPFQQTTPEMFRPLRSTLFTRYFSIHTSEKKLHILLASHAHHDPDLQALAASGNYSDTWMPITDRRVPISATRYFFTLKLVEFISVRERSEYDLSH